MANLQSVILSTKYTYWAEVVLYAFFSTFVFEFYLYSPIALTRTNRYFDKLSEVMTSFKWRVVCIVIPSDLIKTIMCYYVKYFSHNIY